MGNRKTSENTFLESCKGFYKAAERDGHKEEAAKWANQIGHAYKDKGEYVKALEWFKKDFEYSSKASSSEPAKLMPTRLSLGEIYLRLERYDDALNEQHEHLKLAEQIGDVIEQQRSNTQLGRTYLDLYEIRDRSLALADALVFLKKSLDLAQRLRNCPPDGKSSSTYVVELVDAYNNLGLARALGEDYHTARAFYTEGLKLCDDEELGANHAARSRLHHNLGRLYLDIRDFDKAKFHTEIDIQICGRIPHRQGEAKGLNNLGDLYFKSRKYEEATHYFSRALKIANTLEDEDTLCKYIKSNMEMVERAQRMSKTFDKGMRDLSTVSRASKAADGTSRERRCLKEEYELLTKLAGQAEVLQDWSEHYGLAKRLKRLCAKLGDKEKLGDAFELLATSYDKRRFFQKAIKWHERSFEVFKSIQHLQGQIIAKINIANALDGEGRLEDALKAYHEALEAATSNGSRKLIEHRMNALNNIQLLYLVKLNNVDEAKKTERQLEQLKQEAAIPGQAEDEGRCSETESESGNDTARRDNVSDSDHDSLIGSHHAHQGPSQRRCEKTIRRTNRGSASEQGQKRKNWQASNFSDGREDGGEVTASQARRSQRRRGRVQVVSDEERDARSTMDIDNEKYRESSSDESFVMRDSVTDSDDNSDGDSDASFGDTVEIKGKKRVRFSKKRDERERCFSGRGDEQSLSKLQKRRCRKRRNLTSPFSRTLPFAEISRTPPRDQEDEPPLSPDVRSPSRDDQFPELAAPDCAEAPSAPYSASLEISNLGREKSGTSCGIVDFSTHATELSGGTPSSRPKQSAEGLNGFSSGAAPNSRKDHLDGQILAGKSSLLTSYVTNCKRISSGCSPNPAVVERLRSQKVSEEVIIAGCNIEDDDASPLLAALKESEAFSILDLSHNSLSSVTVNAIQDLIESTNQSDLGLTLDLHSNNLGSGALMKICHCPVSTSRIEVLNLAKNALADAAARHLSTILKESQALAVLNLESCSLTTPSIQKLADALYPESSLTKLCIGRNNPVAGFAIQKLLEKLSKLTSFSELDLRGIELDDHGVACIGTLLQKSTSLSVLVLQGVDIQNDGALALANALDSCSSRLAKLDLSLNSFSTKPAAELCSRVLSIHSLSILNLSGNEIGGEAAQEIGRRLGESSCRLKALDLSKCCLGPSGILLILRCIKGQASLFDLNLADNVRSLRLGLSTLYDPSISEFETMDGNHSGVPTVREKNFGTDHNAGEEAGKASTESWQAAMPSTYAGCEPAELRSMKVVTSTPSSTEIRPCQPDPILSEKSSEVDLHGTEDCHVAAGSQRPANAAGCEPYRQPRAMCPEICPGGLGRQDHSSDEAHSRGGNSVDGSKANCYPIHGCQEDAERIGGIESNCCRIPAAKSWVQDLAGAICVANGLRRLDLSENGLTKDDIELLLPAWSCGRQVHSHQGTENSRHHADGHQVHFFVEGRPCCRSTQCCESARL